MTPRQAGGVTDPVITIPTFIPRGYQLKAVDDIRQLIRRGVKSILLVAPTGSGKTAIAGAMIHGAAARKKNILFLAHRKELIDQASSRLQALNVAHGIIRANDARRKPWLTTHVASVPTLIRRTLPPADLIFIDECHRAPGASYQKIIQSYPNAVIVGLSATPRRLDGQGLGTLFSAMVQCPSVAELTTAGYLVPARVYAPSTLDLSKLSTRGGDYKSADLVTTVDRPTITGDIVSHWQKLASDRLTICFAVTVEHSQHLVQQFQSAGIKAEHLDGETPETERGAILRRFSRGETRILSNVGVLTEGYDCPAASCVIMARPTMSESLYLQMAGRVLRPAPGKTDCLILDHANCTAQHGFIDDPREWSLQDSNKKRKSEGYDPAASVRTCKKCWCAFNVREPRCPACGWVFMAPPREIVEKKGDLEEIVKRLVCSECKREMPEAKEGEWCDPRAADAGLGCHGTARRAYSITKISSNAAIAAIQREATEKGYKPGYVWHKIQQLRHGGAHGGSTPLPLGTEAS